MTTVLAAVAVLSLLTLVHELGHLWAAKWAGLRVEEFGLGYPPRLAAPARIGGTEYTLNLIPFGAFVRLAEEGEPGTLLADKSPAVRAAFLIGGSALNLLLSIVLFSMCLATGWPLAHDRAVGVTVVPGSVGQAVGFQDGDLILEANGVDVSSIVDLVVYARSVKGDVRTVTIRRSGRNFTMALPAGGPWFVTTERRGVQLHNSAGWVEWVTYPWPEAVGKAVSEALGSVVALFTLPLKIVRGRIPVDLVRPVGPVGIAHLTGQAAQEVIARGWWLPLLQLTATLSAALAATNLMPLPGLDGGRLLFVGVEAVRGRRLDPRRENLVHLMGIILMLVLILIVTYYDITVPLQLGGR